VDHHYIQGESGVKPRRQNIRILSFSYSGTFQHASIRRYFMIVDPISLRVPLWYDGNVLPLDNGW